MRRRSFVSSHPFSLAIVDPADENLLLAIMRRFSFAIGLTLGVLANSHAQTQPDKAQASPVVDLSQYPATTLSNHLMSVRLYLPDPKNGYYRGTRFDWSGLISRVDYKGHTFFCEFKPQQHDPLNHDDICGTAEEFGMTILPPGYEQAHAGESFMKIGIGVLQRGDEPSYDFWRPYALKKPGPWQVTPFKNALEFRQAVECPGGWSYSYAKTLRLAGDAPVLTISRRLKNTGSRTIETDHYGHNFLRIDYAAAGPDYTLEFPFAPHFGEKAEMQGSVQINGKTLVFSKEIWDKAVWTPFEGFSRPEDNSIRILNHRTGASLTITTDRPLIRLVLYGSGGVVCPEPFVKLLVAPGQVQEWTTTYTFSVGER